MLHTVSDFVSAFYDLSKGQSGYFEQAQDLATQDTSLLNLKSAFISLVSGMEDIADSNSGLSVALSDVSTKLKQNLMLRNGSRLPLSSKATAENQEFFCDHRGFAI